MDVRRLSRRLLVAAAALVVAGATRASAQESRADGPRTIALRLVREGAATRPSASIPVELARPGFVAGWIAAAPEGVACALELRSPDGVVLRYDVDAADGRLPCIEGRLATPGSYRLVAFATSPTDLDVEIRIVVRERSPESLALEARLAPLAERVVTEAESRPRSPPEAATLSAVRELLAAPDLRTDRRLLEILSDFAGADLREAPPPDDVLALDAADALLRGLSDMLPTTHVEILEAHRARALALIARRRAKAAYADAHRAREIAEAHAARDPRSLADQLMLLGFAHQSARELKAAAGWFEKAARAYGPLSGADSEAAEREATSWMMAGSSLNLSGDPKGALTILRRASAEADSRPGLPPEIAFAAGVRLGSALTDSGDFASGIRELRRRLRDAESLTGLKVEELDTVRMSLVRAASEAGDDPVVRAEGERLLATRRRDPPVDPEVADGALLAILLTLQGAGEPERILDLIAERVAEAERDPAGATDAIGNFHLLASGASLLVGDYEQAAARAADAAAYPFADAKGQNARAVRSSARILLRVLRRLASPQPGAAARPSDAKEEADDAPSLMEKSLGALVDGKAGPETWAQLDRAAAIARLTPETRGLAEGLQDVVTLQMAASGEGAQALRRQSALVEKLRATASRSDPRYSGALFSLARLAATFDVAALDGRLVHDLAESAVADLAMRAYRLSPRQSAAAAARVRMSGSLIAQISGAQSDPASRRSAVDAAWTVSEAARAAPAAAARLSRAAAAVDAEEIAELRSEVARAAAKAAKLAGGTGGAKAVAAALAAKEEAERAWTRRLASAGDAAAAFDAASVAPARIAARLSPDETYVAFWRRDEFPTNGAASLFEEATTRYVAFVLRPNGDLALVDLAAADAIDAAVRAFRGGAAGAGVRGVDDVAAPAAESAEAAARLRVLAWDPVLAATGGARRLLVACDGDLHLVPFDALPTPNGVVGDATEVVVVTSVFDLDAPAARPARRALLAVGDVDYDAAPERADASPETRTTSRPAAPDAPASRRFALRGASPDRLAALPATRAELATVATIVAPDPSARLVLAGAEATKARFVAEAPGCRVLHVASHGSYAPDAASALSATSGEQGALLAAAGLRDVVRGYSPFLLTGLAFAGANRSDATGRFEGVLTAEEIAALDLTACDLAVLSACETGVGRARAAGDLASLRQALHAAGVRHALTSLWKVPDEATALLMGEFYRRRFVLGEPVRRALWSAKRLIREAKDPASGAPRFAPRDWAAWVLSGPPN